MHLNANEIDLKFQYRYANQVRLFMSGAPAVAEFVMFPISTQRLFV